MGGEIRGGCDGYACPVCGATMRIIAFITETAPVHQILGHIGDPHQPPPIHPPRGPPDSVDTQERVFLDEDLNQDRYEIDKSSGQKICTAMGRPQGGAQGCAP